MTSLPKGYRAVIIGASGSIGSALCDLVESDPDCGTLVRASRAIDGLDITDEASIARFAASLGSDPVHLLICATGVLTVDGRAPEKSLRQIDPEVMMAQFRTNAVGPALVAKNLLPKLSKDTRSVVGFLSARVGSIGDNRLGGWISYQSSKAALNQIVRTASIELTRTHPQAVLLAIHPGTVATGLSAPYSKGHRVFEPPEAAQSILTSLNGLEDYRSGAFVAYDGSTVPW